MTLFFMLKVEYNNYNNYTMSQEEDLRSALNQFSSRSYQKCKEKLFLILNRQPENAQVYYHLGRTFAKLKMNFESMNYFLVAIEISPNSIKYHVEYAAFLHEIGKVREAEKYAREATKINRNNFQALLCLSKILMETGQCYEARDLLQKCLSIKPSQQECKGLLLLAQKRLGIDMKKQKRFEEEESDAETCQLKKQKHSPEDQSKLVQELRGRIQQLEQRYQSVQMEKQYETHCKVCFQGKAEYINTKCGHMGLCKKCSEQMKKVCPFCKAKGKYMRVWLC